MMKLRTAAWFAAAAMAFAPFFGAGAPAAAQDLYAGKRITMIVSSETGGGFDVYTRFFARYFPKFIPGNSTIIVQNMPGASGTTGANFIAGADKDGTVMGYIGSSRILAPLLGEKNVKYDSREFEWVGSIGKLTNVCGTWAASGVKTIDAAKTKTVRMASTDALGVDAQLPVLLNDKLGTKFRVIRGYTATGSKLSVERGETDGICITYETLNATNPQWFTGGQFNMLIQVSLKPHPAMAKVPNLLDLLPDGVDKQAIELMQVPAEIGRAYIMPPGTAPAQLKIIRDAFDKTMKDPAFLEEAKKLFIEVNAVNGADAAALVQKAYASSPAVVRRTAELLGNPVPPALLDECKEKAGEKGVCGK